MNAHAFRPTFLGFAGALLLAVLTAQPARAQEAEAAATGLDILAATDTPAVGLDIAVTAAQVAATDTVAFENTDQVLDLSAVGGAVTADVLTAHIQYQPLPNQVDADATANNLGILLGLLGVELVDLGSTTIASTAQVAGSCDNLAATGGTTIEGLNLTVLGQLLAANLDISPAPNTELLNTDIVVDLGGSTLSASALVILNEQAVAGDQSSITVNALRISVDISITGVTELTQTVDIVVSRSEAGFVTCPLADLAVTKTANPDPVEVNSLLTYTVTVTNNGPDDAVMARMVDILDPTVIFVSATPSQGVCNEAALVVTCDLGTIPAFSSATIVIEVIPTEVGTVTNEVVVTSVIGDPNLDDNTVVIVTTVIDANAIFRVTKNFDDDNPAEVEVSISCNTGLPLEQSTSISEGRGVGFVVTEFNSGEMDCDVFELVPEGYAQSYAASGDSPSTDDEDGCHFTAVEGNHENACEITNTLQPVEVVVNKLWIDEHPEFQLPTIVEITLICNAQILGGFQDAPAGETASGDWFAQSFIDPAHPGVFLVFPHWDGSTFCSVTEEAEAGVDQDTSDCDFIPLAPGQGGECSIINTRLFAGIPTLSQYGLILLALVMLGVGVFAYRRYS